MNSDFMIFNFLPEHQISKQLPYSLGFYRQENFNSSKTFIPAFFLRRK